MSAPHIFLLSEHVINKIAAGEVVERPASVLKELVENAVDAGGTQLDVDVAAGGRRLVGVTDNGTGMSRDDALLAVERHATSKIREVDDIEQIASLGFRGEALAAIAAVSRFRLETCRRGEATGTDLRISGGKLYDVQDAGCPPGTRIEVRDLFFNVPARRKFLRTHQTELGHLRTAFVVHALAHPSIGMSLTVDGTEVYRLPGGAGLEDRIAELFGGERLRMMRRVERRTAEVEVAGFVGLPALHRADRSEQYVFVNGRATSASVIGYGIREGYRTLLPSGRHPCLFLLLRVPPELVDVNVHPTKREVRFRRPSAVRDAVIEAIRGALRTQPPSEPAPAADEAPPAAPRANPDMRLQIEDLPPPRAFRYPRQAMPEAAPAAAGGGQPAAAPPPEGPFTPPASAAPASAAPPAAEAPGPSSSPWSWCRVLGQMGGLYVVLETEDGMVLMDPHAAHERVLFERFMADMEQGACASQALLLPESVELPPRDAARVRGVLELLQRLGFGISEFGGDTFVVDALPVHVAAAPAAALLVELALGLEQAGGRGGRGRWKEEAIAQAACKSAVKARDRLTLEEIERLVIDLARAEMPYTCPHGRPTLIYTSFRELNRRFGRE